VFEDTGTDVLKSSRRKLTPFSFLKRFLLVMPAVTQGAGEAAAEPGRQQGRLMSDSDILQMVALIQSGSKPQFPAATDLQSKPTVPIAPRKPGASSVSSLLHILQGFYFLNCSRERGAAIDPPPRAERTHDLWME
jgi:hypothetical protein